MTVKLAIMLTLAGVFVFALIYLKRKKALGQPTDLKNSDSKINTSKAAETPKVDAPKPEIKAAENTAVNAAVQTTAAKIIAEPVQKTASPVTESRAEILDAFNEEPMLKRHHLHNVRLMLEATTFPRPTDSALSRHYDEMIEAKAEACLEDEAKMARLIADYEACQNTDAAALDVSEITEMSAEDFADEPMLKRHYLHNIRLMLAATTFPHPTDSVLSRHYEEMIDAKAEACLEDEAKLARLIADYEAAEQQAQNEEQDSTPILQHKHVNIPEDSALRRHYLGILRANIEKNKGPRPSDSVLRRHYDAMIAAEIENYLS